MESTFDKNLFNNFMETWIIPWIKEKQDLGELEKPVDLIMAQIIFDPNGGEPKVRINDQVRGKMSVKLSESIEKPVEAGDPVYFNQIDNVEAFELEEDDQDFGHATLLKFPDKWLISFNFIYNKKLSRKHIEAAKEFLHSAKSALELNFHRSCIDNLHSASELTAKAYLLSRPDPAVMTAKSHNVVHSKINAERRIGNVDEMHVSAFNKLRELRSSARYLNSDLGISSEELGTIYETIENFVNEVQKVSKPKL